MNIGFYGILPATVRYDRELRPLTRLLYAEVSASMNYNGECDINPRYLARLLEVSTPTVVKYLGKLVKNGHLDKLNIPGKFIYRIPSETIYVKHEEEVSLTEQEARERDKNINEIILHWNTLFKDRMKYRVKRTEEVLAQLTERLETFTKDDILTALQNRHDFVRQNPWYQATSNIHIMTDIQKVIDSDENITKSLNMVITKPDNIDMKKEVIKFKTGDHDREALK